MNNRTITFSRFFSQKKNLFSPRWLVLFLVLLLWGLVPNQAFADLDLAQANSYVRWYKERAAFKVVLQVSEDKGIDDVVTYARWKVNGEVWANVWATNIYGNSYVKSYVDSSKGQIYCEHPSWTHVPQNETRRSGEIIVTFWIYPKNPNQDFDIDVDYEIVESNGSKRRGYGHRFNGKPELYDYKLSFEPSFLSNGYVPVKLSVSNTGKYSQQSTNFILQQSFDDGKNYVDYHTEYNKTSWDVNSTINIDHDGKDITAQQFANGVWIRGIAATDPDKGSGDYVYRSYSQAYHTGATQVIEDRNLAVVQNGSDLALTWKVLRPTGSQASKQDMSDYQIERLVNGEWQFVANVPTNTSISTYTYTYDIPDNELRQGTVNYEFRVWKKRFESAGKCYQFMCSNTKTLAVNTNYRSISISNLEPNTSSQMAVINWSTSASGAWDSDVKIVAEVTNITAGGTTEYNASYNATSMNLTGLQGCNTYKVQLLAKVGSVVVSESTESTFQMPDDGEREIENFIASKGYYNTYVRLTWDVPANATDFTHFNIVRKNLSTGVSSNVEQITHSGLLSYNYQDYGMDAGVLYEYMVEGYSTCEGTATLGASKTDMGFSQPYAKASGNIAYSGSQAVEGVAVSAIASDASTEKNRSLYFDGQDENSNVQMPKEFIDFTTTDAYTVQFWINPSEQTGDHVYVFSKNSTMDLLLDRYDSASSKYKVRLYVLGSFVTTTTLLSRDTWAHITFSVKLNEDLTQAFGKFYINGVQDGGTYTFGIRKENISGPVDGFPNGYHAEPLMMGSAASGDQGFKGYMDEVRIYNVELDSETIAKTYNLYLSGKEDNLMAYYRCDEEGSSKLFDLAATGSNFHMYDADIRSMATHSKEVPSAEQLSIKTYTDVDGNYLLNTIPYTSEGLQYNIVPALGIHKFTPNKRPIYVSPESVVFNNIDFEDTSSFPVSGIVYYEGTLVPVEGADLYVDGVVCSSEGELISTDATGKFTISVPIGDHHITVKKDGHTFVNEGRYPIDANNIGTKHTFDQAMSGLTFYDNTLVNVAGRVVGGEIEAAKPLGLLQSKNNIGAATIKLSYGTYALNMIEDVDGTDIEYVENPDNVGIASATKNIKSTAYRAGGNNEEVKYFYITTDSVTGEFSVMVPPLAYTIEGVTVGSNSAIKFSDFSVINAVNPTVAQTDSIINEDGTVDRFKYNASSILTYRSTASFSVEDGSNAYGAYGSAVIAYSDLTTSEDVTLYEVNNGEVSYTFGAPIFVRGFTYNFDLYGYEEYVNNDGDTPVSDKVPLQNSVVTITNEMSNGQPVYVEDGTVDGKEVSQGEFASLNSNQLQLDSLGRADYKWVAGYPNITAPYKRGLSIVYEVNGENLPWSGNETFEGIVFGELPSGNNFVTSGPDEVLMILRDPAGSNSHAYWEAGQTVTTETTHSGTGSIGSESVGTIHAGAKQDVIVGTPAAGTSTEVEFVFDVEAGVSINSSLTGTGAKATTITTTKTISTSDSEDYVGAIGDVFIGTATNIVFGNARNVGLKKDASTGEYSIELEDVLSTGSSFGTAFNYTQNYIEEVLIPNLYLNRDALLQTVASTSGITNKDSRDPIYITTLDSDDERFGSKNTDTDVWGSEATVVSSTMTGPSYTMLIPTGANYDPTIVYQDMVLWYNTQIEVWERTLASNEESKVKVIENRNDYLSENLSFDQGVSIESSTTTCESEATIKEWTVEACVYVNTETGLTYGGAGAAFKTSTTIGGVYSGSTTDQTETCSTTGFSLADGGLNDALSIDVFNAPDGYGAIFVTRGGQTSCPYEDAVHTKYYKPGTEISAATMQIEIPVIESDKYFATDVPAGGTASYVLSLRNDSETGDDVWFDLKVVDATNANGASLSVDGSKLTEGGRGLLVPAGGTLTKTLQLQQTELDVLDYENIAVVLVSQCQSDPTGLFPVVADTIYLSAQFVPTCSNITLDIPETTLNMFTSDTLTLQMKDFDRDYNTFESIRLQYKYANDADWTLAKEYVLDEADVTSSTELLPTGGVVTVELPMSNSAVFPDGVYQFRLQTTCAFGVEGVYTNSDVVTVIKDMVSPQVMGTPNPSDGILSAGDDISLAFNENIRSGSLTDAANFKVTGELNGATIAHDVTLRLDGTAYVAAATEADIHLANSSFAIDFWVKYTGAGTFVEHGSATNKFIAAVNEAGNLVVTIGETVITSDKTIPSDSWCFITMNYDNEGIAPVFTAIAANDASTIQLFNAESVPAYSGVGVLAIGKGLTGMMHEVALWNRARTTTEAQSEMYVTKVPSTLNLIGYWGLDEGHGMLASDAARNRHMTLANESWYLNNDNLAAQLNGDGYLMLNISTVSAGASESHMLEMWFRGEAGQTDATLFSIYSKMAVKFNAKGYLVLVQDGEETVLCTTNYLNDSWHHIAFNSLSGGFTAVYVDGVAVKQLATRLVNPIQGSAIVVGADRTYVNGEVGYNYGSYFTGAVDEVRYWVSTLNADYIKNNRYNRVDIEDVAGLNAYYPFDKAGLDSGNQVVYQFDLEDASENSVGAATAVNVTEADNAPALQAAPDLVNLQFSYVASEREIVINLLEEAYRIEGTTVNFTVKNVRDDNNNLMEAATWSAFVNQNRLTWGDSEFAFEQLDGKKIEFSTIIANEGSEYENWMISGLPTWMKASVSTGTLNPLSQQTITFTIDADMPIGSYEEVLYLSGNDGIYVSLPISLAVKAESPAWSVDPTAFENSMAVIGTLSVKGVYSYDSEDIVAAFIGETCVGVESPVYNSRYDAYFVMMDIYGNDTELSEAIKFKVWDASTGIIHPVVVTSSELTFKSDDVQGSITTPFTWDAQDYVEQAIDVTSGWNWIALGVEPTSHSVADVLATVTENAFLVKDKTSFSYMSDMMWSGKLTDINLGSMYRLQMKAEDELLVTGATIEQQETPITINNGWNWIGYTPLFNLTVADAFADLEPQTGDMVKSISGFAVYQDYEWIGKLTTLEPGKGYMYKSASVGSKEFTYPSAPTYATTNNLRMLRTVARGEASEFTPIGTGAYSGNMTMIATVQEDENILSHVDVAVYADEECRTSEVSEVNGLLYLTIPGDDTTDLTFKVVYDGETYEVDQELSFHDDAHYGSIDEPYVIQLARPTGINHVGEDIISIYPNPAKDIVYVESVIDYVSMSVSSVAGAILYETTTPEATLDFSGYAEGVYFVTLVDEDGNTYTERVIKQ